MPEARSREAHRSKHDADYRTSIRATPLILITAIARCGREQRFIDSANLK